MSIWKKLFFIPFLIVSVIGCVVYANILLADPLGDLFSLQSGTLLTIIYLCIGLSLSALFFSFIVLLSNNWFLPLFAAIISGLIPLLMITESPLNIILCAGFLLSFIIGMLYQMQKMRSYITFSATQLLIPPIKLILLVLTLTLAYGYYSVATTDLTQKGFSIPDPLIDAAIAMSGTSQATSGGVSTPTQPAIPSINLTSEQVAQLKQNPALLKQFGLSAKDLDAYLSPKKTTTGKEPSESSSLIKTMVKNQLNTSIQPYLSYVPPLLAIVFFGSVASMSSLAGFILPLLIWILFILFEKSGFIRFDKELREVKKLVV